MYISCLRASKSIFYATLNFPFHAFDFHRIWLMEKIGGGEKWRGVSEAHYTIVFMCMFRRMNVCIPFAYRKIMLTEIVVD